MIQAIARIRLGHEVSNIVHVIDMALIMAGGQGRNHEMQRLLDHLEEDPPSKRRKTDIPDSFGSLLPPLQMSISRTSAPSLEAFQKHITKKHTPLVLTNCIGNWPALNLWTSPSYLLKRTINGSRLVPIELGDSYVSDTWSQKVVPFSTFLHDHLLKDSHPKGYLAQHDLLTQIPALRNDITVPDYCYTDPPKNPPDKPQVAYKATEDVVMNVWIGPRGTKSPLHNDPYENIFAQVVGHKYFRLYPPKTTENVYPRGVEGGIPMGNTSQVSLVKEYADQRLMWRPRIMRTFPCLRRQSMWRRCWHRGSVCIFRYGLL
jgi:hypothetical protein